MPGLPNKKRKNTSKKQSPAKKRKLSKNESHQNCEESPKQGVTLQEFLKRRKKRKAKLAKKKTKSLSHKVPMRAKQKSGGKFKKN